MHAVVHGFCMLLVLSNERELRPWEMFGDDDESVSTAALSLDPTQKQNLFLPGGNSDGSVFSFDGPWTASAASLAHAPPRSSHKTPSSSSDAASQTTRGTGSGTARSRMGRMNPFGPGNAFDQEAWVERWRRVAWWRKGVWTFSLGRIPSFEEGIREIHHAFMYQSLLWSSVVTVPVVVVLTALPVCGLY